MRNRYAAGALALSAGLSAYTLYALPRGGVARSWVTTQSRGAMAERRAPAAPASAQRAPAGPGFSAEQALASASAFQATAPAAPTTGAPVYGAFFAKRGVSPPVQAIVTQRPDMASLIVAGRGLDRVVGSSVDGGAETGGASATGALEGFRWQQGPRAGDGDDSRR